MNAFGWALAAGMLITGSINTLSTKAADLQTAQNRYGNIAYFNHPFVQAVGMFIGEFSCLLAYTLFSWRAASRGDETFQRAKPHSKLIFLIPALCDMCATSIMYVGLSLTSSSIFQMLRGSVVIFTATFSAVFLKKKQAGFKWVGVAFVMVGTAVVGASSFVSSCKDTCAGSGGAGSDSKAMVGNVLIIVAQVIVATQMVVEEMFIEGYDIPPLQVVGWEGAWGLSIMSAVLLAMYYIPTQGTPMCSFNSGPNATVLSNSTCPTPDTVFSSEAVCSHVEDTYDAFVQFGNNGKIILFTALNVCSIAFFNFFGVRDPLPPPPPPSVRLIAPLTLKPLHIRGSDPPPHPTHAHKIGERYKVR